MKLYKFRPLGNDESLNRVAEILQTGKFWCSRLWEQNDPMEGIYTYMTGPNDAHPLGEVFSAKNRIRICSFSGESALSEKTIWGYYANGFKGVAIEIEIDEAHVRKVRYKNKPEEWSSAMYGESLVAKVERIVTTKLTSWRNEREYRYLTEETKPKQEIGRIKSIFFGEPYRGTQNFQQIHDSTPTLQDYRQLRQRLVSIAKARGYACFSSGINRSKDGKWSVSHTPI